MSDKDIAVQPSFNVPSGGTTITKPCYLVRTDGGGPLYIALELPDMNAACIKFKGVQTNVNPSEAIENYATILKQVNKKQIVELYIPWHRINSIQNLVFVAK